ncbi:MAG: 16S rRNA processing protein RimM [Myxococcales bacterium]|nr:16S rRNA processing protein RimM [Myxococcales bacterium]
MASEGQVEIGIVARPHGVRGELRVHLHNPESTAIDVVAAIFVGERGYEIAKTRIVKGAALVCLKGLDDRDAAQLLVGKPVSVLRNELELEDDELLLSDFLGCELSLPDGSPWGKVVEVVAGTQDRLVIHQGDIERYLPLVDVFIQSFDLKGKSAIVTPPEELPEWERE